MGEVTSNSTFLAEKVNDFDMLVDDIAFDQLVSKLFVLKTK